MYTVKSTSLDIEKESGVYNFYTYNYSQNAGFTNSCGRDEPFLL